MNYVWAILNKDGTFQDNYYDNQPLFYPNYKFDTYTRNSPNIKHAQDIPLDKDQKLVLLYYHNGKFYVDKYCEVELIYKKK